jgi:ankyrin repeat protein
VKNGSLPVVLQYIAANHHTPDAFNALLDFENGYQPLLNAVLYDHGPIVKALLAVPGINIAIEIDGLNLLMLAAVMNKASCIPVLCARFAVDTPDKHGKTPLMRAIAAGHVNAAKALLSNGACITIKDLQGRTAIAHADSRSPADMKIAISEALESRFLPALKNGDLELVNEYIAVFQGDISRFHGEGDTSPLFTAVTSGHTDIVSALANIPGMDLTNRYRSSTLLHAAALYGYAEITSFLLRHGCSVDERDDFGNTPLIVAAKYEHPAVIKVLLEEGRANAKMLNKNGKDALYYAVKHEDHSSETGSESSLLLARACSLKRVNFNLFRYVADDANAANVPPRKIGLANNT